MEYFNISPFADDISPLAAMERIAKELKLDWHLWRAGFKEKHKTEAYDMLVALLSSVFTGAKNLYQFYEDEAFKKPCSRDTVYRFLKDPCNNWGKLELNLGVQMYRYLRGLNDPGHRYIFVVDDTKLERPEAKKSELVCRTFNHVSGKSINGYTNMTLGVSDSFSFIPLQDRLISSQKEDLRIAEARKVDGRSSGAHRRKDAVSQENELLIDMVDTAMDRGIEADTIAFDSWFFSDELIRKFTKRGLTVVSLVRSNILYHPDDEPEGVFYTAKQIVDQRFKTMTKHNIIGSVIATTKKGLKLKVVFVNNMDDIKHPKAIVCTDITMTDEEIVAAYSTRWGIETHYRDCRQMLGLGTESQAHNFDTYCAMVVISALRYLMLEYLRRTSSDMRSISKLFRETASEVRALPYVVLVQRVLQMVRDLPEKLSRAGVIKDGCMDTVRQIIGEEVYRWYLNLTQFMQNLMSKWLSTADQIRQIFKLKSELQCQTAT